MNIQSISTSLLRSQNSTEANVVSRVASEAKVVAPVQENEQPKESTQPVSHEQIAAAVESVREYIEPINNNLEFSINEDTDQVVIKVIDSATKELIRQIPSEEMIAIAKALDSIKGLFIKQQA